MTDGTKPPETTDPDLATLKRDKELLELRQQIAASRASALASRVPSLDDAPKGEVTLGEKAGSLAPWLTQRALAVAAGEIAIEVQGRLLGLAAADRQVILVTDDSSLQAGDLVSRQVLSTMTRRAGELLQLKTYVIDAVSALERRIGQGDEAPDLVREALEAEPAPVTAPDVAAEEETAATTGGGPLGAAVDLMKLVATDFTVTAVDVQVRSAALAELVAGRLKALKPPEATFRDKPAVILDGLTTVGENSVTLAAYDGLIGAANSLSVQIEMLRSRAAAVAAEATDLRAQADQVRTAWTAAVADKDVTPTRAKELKAELDDVTRRLTWRVGAVAAAQAVVDRASEALTAARTDLTALVTADATGVSPLLRTCSREGLRGPTRTITHVLHVDVGQAAADVVTRRSVLGSSGRIGYLAGINTTWTLVATGDGRVVAGGDQSPAIQMTHDLATGGSTENPVASSRALESDPLVVTEWVMRVVVVLVALGIAALGLAAVANLF